MKNSHHVLQALALSFIICHLSFSGAAAQTVPAFPGAEGHGRYVTGGRGGRIVHVTNLNDSGTGSFRAAVSGSDKKIVVFDVGGVIALTKDLTIGANTTVLGQTAPSPGITLRYYTVQPSENCIIRFIRCRRGEEKDVNDGADAIWQRNKTGIMIDHCSFSWSIDEVASFYDNNNFTMQWCTIGESLVHPGHSKGPHGYGGIWGGKLASFHHNLICHVDNRSPRFNGARYNWQGYTSNMEYTKYKWQNAVQAENVDFRNCVIYNIDGCYGGPGGGQINMVGNYYQSGPASTINKLTRVSVAASGNMGNDATFVNMTSRYYLDDNLIDGTLSTKMTYDSGTLGSDVYSKDPGNYYDCEHYTVKGYNCVKIRMDAPAPTGVVTTHTAENAFDNVLLYSGASLYPDDVDLRYFDEVKGGKESNLYYGSATSYVKNGTTYSCVPQPGRIDKVSDVGGYSLTASSRSANYDTDGDGIPDAWEDLNDLDPGDASDGKTYSLDPVGYYTNLEVYANSLVQDIMLGGNEQAKEAVEEYYPAYTNLKGQKIAAINKPTSTEPEPGGDGKTYTVYFNGSDVVSEAGFFTFKESTEDKHNFNTKFTGTYNGLQYTSGLKMETSTKVLFTTTATSTVTIVQSTWSDATIQFDGTELDVSSATTPTGSTGVRVYTIKNVAAGSHRITRGSGESGLFFVSVEVAGGTTAIRDVKPAKRIDTAAYNLSGQKVGTDYKGLVIRNGRKLIRR